MNVTRNQTLLLALLADVVGAVVILGMLPLGWSTSLLVFGVYGVAVYFVVRSLLDRGGRG